MPVTDEPPGGVRVVLCQALCPARHCIIAVAAEGEQAVTKAEANCRGLIERMLATHVLNRWCDLCQAPADTWTYEVGKTRFRTLAEAEPELREEERKQRVTAALFKGLAATGGSRKR